MKGLNNDNLPEYVRLQRQIIAYLKTPQYVNYYKSQDKKLTKNTVKRCVLEPFIEKFLKPDGILEGVSEVGTVHNLMRTEIARFID